jgi:hypothetical protein
MGEYIEFVCLKIIDSVRNGPYSGKNVPWEV